MKKLYEIIGFAIVLISIITLSGCSNDNTTTEKTVYFTKNEKYSIRNISECSIPIECENNSLTFNFKTNNNTPLRLSKLRIAAPEHYFCSNATYISPTSDQSTLNTNIFTSEKYLHKIKFYCDNISTENLNPVSMTIIMQGEEIISNKPLIAANTIYINQIIDNSVYDVYKSLFPEKIGSYNLDDMKIKALASNEIELAIKLYYKNPKNETIAVNIAKTKPGYKDKIYRDFSLLYKIKSEYGTFVSENESRKLLLWLTNEQMDLIAFQGVKTSEINSHELIEWYSNKFPVDELEILKIDTSKTLYIN